MTAQLNTRYFSLLLAALFAANALTAQTIFGILDNTVVEIDKVTGDAELLYETGPFSSYGDMAYDGLSDKLYILTDHVANPALAVLDPCSGELTEIGPIQVLTAPLDYFIEAMAFDGQTGKLYGMLGSPSLSPYSSYLLCEINTSNGIATPISAITYSGGGFADADGMDFVGGTLYMVDAFNPGAVSSAIYTIDIAAGVANFVGYTGYYNVNSLTYETASGKLYAMASVTDEFLEINIATGAGSFVGYTHSAAEGDRVITISGADDCLCKTPYNLTTTVTSPTSVVLTWSADDFAAGHQLKGRKLGAPSSATSTSATTVKSVFGLAPGTTYEWGVRSQCSTGFNSKFSAEQQFTTPTLSKEEETGISDTIDFELYPNPATDYLILRSTATNATYEILDPLGHVVSSEKLIHLEQQIQIGHLPSGIYFLRIGSVVEQFVVEH